jgi:hypothetical protein
MRGLVTWWHPRNKRTSYSGDRRGRTGEPCQQAKSILVGRSSSRDPSHTVGRMRTCARPSPWVACIVWLQQTHGGTRALLYRYKLYVNYLKAWREKNPGILLPVVYVRTWKVWQEHNYWGRNVHALLQVINTFKNIHTNIQFLPVPFQQALRVINFRSFSSSWFKFLPETEDTLKSLQEKSGGIP